MSGPIVYIDRSEIREGRLEELREAIDELVEFVDTREPQLISYGFYLDEEAGRMTVVAIHPDSASLELHMEVGGPQFRKFKDLIGCGRSRSTDNRVTRCSARCARRR